MWLTGRSRPSRWHSVLAMAALLSAEGYAADKTAADYYIHSLPGAPDGPLLKMHAGHIEVTPEHHGNLFFWLYGNRHIADKQRTVIWLNGGPGCSSMDGALMEVGPYRVREGGKLEYNDGSWDEFANLLFVDNPVGTGFSYVDTDSFIHELDEMASQFVTFLEKWFDIFPEYMHDDIYIAGESYAGQHIPYIAKAILDRNNNTRKDPWNLAGLLIGNGWISPVDQYLAYLPFAYENGLIQGGTSKAQLIEKQQAQCVEYLNSEDGQHSVDSNVCERILTDLLEVTKNKDGEKYERCVNMYDIRLRDDDSCGMNWPPDLQYVTPYLRDKKVIEALHINPDKRTGWSECSGAVSSNFRAQNSAPSIDLLPGLLEHVPIVLFSGDKDLICNHIGTEELINKMEWNGGKGFELSPGIVAPRRDWTFEHEPAGIYQEARNLTYVKFYNSSHMVPFDYARRSRDMLDRFMKVDIASIGGKPSESLIDGEKGPLTSVGSHPNSTAAQEAQKDKLKQAEWKAYYRSGEVALVVVVIAASLWGWFVWRDRRQRAGYSGLFGTGKNPSAEGREGLMGGMGLENFRSRRSGVSDRDVEAADFDERELDSVRFDGMPMRNKERGFQDHPPASRGAGVVDPEEDRRYSLGEASESGESDVEARKQRTG